MRQKILIVGGVAGGASAAARIRRSSEEDQIIIFEKGPHVSFSNCSLPYYLSGVVENKEDLLLMDAEHFMSQYNIEVRVREEVTFIDRKLKKVTIKKVNLEDHTETTYEESYDKIVLSPGAAPIVPAFPGKDLIHFFTIRNVENIDVLHQYLTTNKVKNIAVIGGGFIGIEAAENLKLAGFNVTLIEALNQILRPFDYDMVQIFHKEMHDKGISLKLNRKVECFETDHVVLAGGEKIEAEAVLMAIGVSPETKLAKASGLELGETGAIQVNENYQTNDEDIYAVGDAIEVEHALLHAKAKISLAGPAVKQGRAVADHIYGKQTSNKGYIGSSAIKVFDYHGAATGLSEALIKFQELNVSYEVVRIAVSDKVGIMPDANPMHLKLLFDTASGKILGAQAIGKGDVTKRMDVIATAMKFGATVDDLRDLELCYAPPFGTAKDVVNYAGYVGSNLKNKTFRQVQVDQVRKLVSENAVLIDVREKGEYEYAHIIGAINIPLSELRERISEIPRDKNVYLHCRTGQRSYNAVLALQNLGYENVYNVAGSFLALSFYEYFNDLTLQREKIVTAYNFR